MTPKPYYWHIEDPEERAREALAVATRLETSLAATQRDADRLAREIYEGDAASRTREQGQTVTNTIWQAVDTFVSDVTHQRVRIQFLTDGGRGEERQRSQLMSKAVEGAFDEAGLYGVEGVEWCRDGFVYPSGGVLRVLPDYESGRVLIERVRGHRLLTDPRDSRLGKPRQLVYVEDYPVEVLQARFPEHKEELQDAETAVFEDYEETDRQTEDYLLTERVKVYELWHLPSSDVDSSDPEAWGMGDKDPDHDGRHTMLAARGKGIPIVLIDEPWPLQTFPFAFFIPYKRMVGRMGYTVCERLRRAQDKIDKTHARIDSMLNLFSRLVLYVNRHANMKPTDVLSNDYTRVFEGDLPAGEAMQQFTPSAVNPELIQYTQRLIDWTEKFSAKTELAMRGAKPPGVDSGIALQTLLEQDNVRHSTIYRANEAAYIQLARVWIETCRLLANNPKSKNKFLVSWGEDEEMRSEKWGDIDLDNERFRMRPWPTNLFGQTPSAKLSAIMEIFRTGGLPTDQLLTVLVSQFPDIRSLFGDQNALLANIQTKLDDIVKSGEVTDATAPHGDMDLELARKHGVARLNALEAERYDPKVVKAVANFLALLSKVPRQPAVPPAAPPPAPAQQGIL